MDVSLIICTRNRCEQLARCLQSLRRITFERSWELVIVDNGSVDETAAIVQEFLPTISVPVVYVFESTVGLGNARNAGLWIARGQIVSFTDDDCYPASDFLNQVWSSFRDQSVGYITGRIMLHDLTDYPISINTSTIHRTYPAGSFLPSGAVQGANMAFRRPVLLQIGGFDPLFGSGSLFPTEDIEAASRANALGWKGQYCPEVIVRHHHRRKEADIPRLLKSYGIGIGAYHMKLLLRGHKFLWFARSICQVGQRYRWERGAVMWEPVGWAKYVWIYVIHSLRRKRGRYSVE
jgi:glycosyltransferase involved in cell wall biosynthesis